MTTRRALLVALTCVATAGVSAWAQAPASDGAYLTWTAKQADTVGRATYETGQVGRTLDLRVLRTERSYNYKLAATWLTADVIRATARLQILSGRLEEKTARAMVADALIADELAFLVEIDPREGSGVIPDEWIPQLEPRAGKERVFAVIGGTKRPERRKQPLFQGVRRRDYAYDQFWVTFPRSSDGVPTIPPEATELQLVVRIYDKVGRVTWPLTADLRK